MTRTDATYAVTIPTDPQCAHGPMVIGVGSTREAAWAEARRAPLSQDETADAECVEVVEDEEVRYDGDYTHIATRSVEEPAPGEPMTPNARARLASLEWHIAPEDQGQIVVVSYAADPEHSRYLRHTFDASDRSEQYDEATGSDYEDLDEFEPWNGAADLRDLTWMEIDQYARWAAESL